MEGKARTKPLEHPSGPWLVFFDENRRGKDHQVFYSFGEERYCIESILQTQDSIYIPTHQGWILTMNPYDDSSCLRDPMTMANIRLPRPPWDLKGCECILSSSPTNPKCKVLVANMKERKLFFCQPSDKQWTEYKYDLGNNPIDCITTFDDKFCGVTLQNNFATIDCPPNPGINILEPIVTEWPIGVSTTTAYIVQSYGELFFLERRYDHSKKTVHISIMKKDSSEQEWVAVDSIGHRVFLLGANSCSAVSCSSSELGIKGNCVYFVENSDGGLYCFDLEEGFISAHLPCLKSDVCNKVTPIWMIPAI